MEAQTLHPDFGQLVFQYRTPNPRFLWIGGAVIEVFLLFILAVNRVPIWAVCLLAVPLTFLPIGMFRKGRRLESENYEFFETGFTQNGTLVSVQVPYSTLTGIWTMTVVRAVSGLASLAVQTSDGRNFKMPGSMSRVSRTVAADYEKVKGLLIRAVTHNIMDSIAAGKTLPWTGGLSVGDGLVTPDGNSIPWTQLRFSLFRGVCTIAGPTGLVGRVSVFAGNSSVFFAMARANGTEFAFPRYRLAIDTSPTASGGFPVGVPGDDSNHRTL